MTTVTRYRLFRDSFSDCFCDIDESERGSYVSFDDYEALEKRLAKAEALLFMARVGHPRHHPTWGCAACNALSVELENERE